MKHKSQSGRSMVEILGTLAIIGVLSIGGIAGYSYGMDKYHANQTINEVMLIGVDIITQLSQQRTQAPVLSADFGTKTSAGYNVSIVQNPDDETQYGVQLMGIPSDVCKIVGDGLKNTVAVYVGGEKQNSETEEDPCDESDSNTMEFYFEPITTSFKCEPACGEGELCRWGECVNEGIEITPKIGGTCARYSNECQVDDDGNQYTGASCACCSEELYCIVCPDYNGESCTLSDGTAGQCAQGKCRPKTGCNDKNPCTGKNEYCASPNSDACNAFPTNSSGTCIAADFKPITIKGKEYWISNTPLSWWDADAACKAMGFKGLISIDKLIKDSQLTNLGKDLKEYLAFIEYPGTWTSDYPDSCTAYTVYLPNSQAYAYSRNKNDADKFAICQ